MNGNDEGDAGAASWSSASHSPAAGFTPEDVLAPAVPKKCPTVRCEAACRRQTDNHGRGNVVLCDACPKHAFTYLRCVQCRYTIHVGCADICGSITRLAWVRNWKCSRCTSGPTTEPPAAAPTLPSSGLTSDGPGTASVEEPEVTYENFDSMHGAMRRKGFRTQSTNYVVRNGARTGDIKSVRWECKDPACKTNFYAYALPSGEFSVRIKPHGCGCSSKPAEKPVSGTVVLKHSHELSAYDGLKECIEELGASGVIMGVHPQPAPMTSTTTTINHHCPVGGCTPTSTHSLHPSSTPPPPSLPCGCTPTACTHPPIACNLSHCFQASFERIKLPTQSDLNILVSQ